ncbi:AMP-binding protein [Escherichia coli]
MFSYREMREQVVALANLLRERGRRGQRGGGTTALGLLTLALHAIVEAGAWLPLDTGYPDDRLKMMLEDARPSLLITTDDQLPRFSDVPNLTSLCYNAPLTPRAVRRCNFHNRTTRLISSLPLAPPAGRKG